MKSSTSMLQVIYFKVATSNLKSFSWLNSIGASEPPTSTEKKKKLTDVFFYFL